MKIQLYTACFILVSSILSTLSVFALQNQQGKVIAGSASRRAEVLGIPTLDKLAGDWVPMVQVENMPAVHNFNHMLVVNRDLTSYFYIQVGYILGKKDIP